MNRYSHKMFLCGHFACEKNKVSFPGWERVMSSEKEKEGYSQLFYPEFVRAYLPNNESSHMEQYRLSVDKNVSLELQGGAHELEVKEIVLYLTTYNVALFSVEIDHETEDLNTVTLVLSLLRSPAFYTQAHDGFAECALNPVREAYKLINGVEECPLNALVENGNKFKAKYLFTVVIKYVAPVCIVVILAFSILEALGVVKV